MGSVNRQFGTFRGAVRLALSYGELALGLAPVKRPVPQEVRRLVFVCHGNICRSAFAEVLAQSHGLRTASLGLSIKSGRPAYGPVMEFARTMDLDMSAHRTTSIDDYVPQEGDYLLAMEVRHLRKLAANPQVAHLPRGLLGLYGPRRLPHLHDPFGLSADYMRTALRRIAGTIDRLKADFPGAAIS